ncbi:hypothetical protein-transmembrane prediction [Rhodopirellula baltica SH 1]|uniref:Uncharacterized protein n=2 Tax=Rhodopirellula baltica TaxID=265606 RepID=Q7UIF3_RHOBA|nr:hypothetical protein-transmembrane prediction [Rhodopirellula baltica SH 1]
MFTPTFRCSMKLQSKRLRLRREFGSLTQACQTNGSAQSFHDIAFAASMNPYEPSTSVSPDASSETDPRFHLFAGWWLIVAGMIHFFVANFMGGVDSFASIVWSPCWLATLGILVLFRFHFANVIARLIGSFTLVAIAIALVLFLAGVGSGSEPMDANKSVSDPPPWQVAFWMSVLAGTFLPPWWALQRLVAASDHPRT